MSQFFTDQQLLHAGASLGDLTREDLSAIDNSSGSANLGEIEELSFLVGELESLYTAEIEPLPAELQSKILADTQAFVRETPAQQAIQSTVSRNSQQAPRTSQFPRWWQRTELGWAAAACLAVAWYGSLRIIEGQSNTVSSLGASAYLSKSESELRLADFNQLQEEADLLASNFQANEGYENVQGEVLWHQKTQQGYLLLTGLPENNSEESQYQLWIADGRDGAPVDGGVFNFVQTGQSDSLLIPIDAKLQVDTPVAFVITEERPGGVVVSAQDRVVAIATAES